MNNDDLLDHFEAPKKPKKKKKKSDNNSKLPYLFAVLLIGLLRIISITGRNSTSPSPELTLPQRSTSELDSMRVDLIEKIQKIQARQQTENNEQ